MIFYLRHSGRTDFGKLYFQNEDPLTATLAAFGTYFTDSIGRPNGAAKIGHYGDTQRAQAKLARARLERLDCRLKHIGNYRWTGWYGWRYES